MNNKKNSLLALGFISSLAFAQQNYTGLLNSPNVGLLQGFHNPAELVNMNKKNEAMAGNFSISISNNKISSKDIIDGNFEAKLFDGKENITLNAITQMNTIGYGLKWKKFAFSFGMNTNGILGLENIDPNIGDALVNSGNNIGSLPLNLQVKGLQKVSLAMYSDIQAGFGMKMLNTIKHKLNLGINAKILRPIAFVNVGIDNLNASLQQVSAGVNAITATGNINIAYSSNIGLNAQNINPFENLLGFKNIKGISLGFGFNYQLHKNKENTFQNENDENEGKKKRKAKTNDYILNIGGSLSNTGRLKFDSNNTKSYDYNLNVTPNINNPNGLDLNQLGNISTPEDIYNFLKNNNFITNGSTKPEVKIELPALLNLYADAKIAPIFYTSFYYQKNMNKVSNNAISTPTFFTITPRLVFGKFEIFTPFSNCSTAKTTVGAGIKAGLFYISSGSALSFAFSEVKAADFSIGFSKGF